MQTLVTFADYQAITLDTTSAEATVTAALERALGELEDFLNRPLELGEYTENHVIGPDGQVYPKAYPILSVSIPTTAELVASTYLRNIESDENPFSIVTNWTTWPHGRRSRVDVTYMGGYTHDIFPDTLREVLCQIARSMVSGAGIGFAGASMIRLGDAQVSFAGGAGSAAIDSWLPGASRRVKKWRYR